MGLGRPCRARKLPEISQGVALGWSWVAPLGLRKTPGHGAGRGFSGPLLGYALVRSKRWVSAHRRPARKRSFPPHSTTLPRGPTTGSRRHGWRWRAPGRFRGQRQTRIRSGEHHGVGDPGIRQGPEVYLTMKRRRCDLSGVVDIIAEYRWYRRIAPQPPATRCHPSGMQGWANPGPRAGGRGKPRGSDCVITGRLISSIPARGGRPSTGPWRSIRGRTSRWGNGRCHPAGPGRGGGCRRGGAF